MNTGTGFEFSSDENLARDIETARYRSQIEGTRQKFWRRKLRLALVERERRVRVRQISEEVSYSADRDAYSIPDQDYLLEHEDAVKAVMATYSVTEWEALKILEASHRPQNQF